MILVNSKVTESSFQSYSVPDNISIISGLLRILLLNDALAKDGTRIALSSKDDTTFSYRI